MFKVKNNKPTLVIISDIGLKVKSGQEVDLDDLFPRSLLERSSNLSHALNRKVLDIVHKDEFMNGMDAAAQKLAQDVALLSMEERIKAEIAEKTAQFAHQPPQQAIISTPEPKPIETPPVPQNQNIDALQQKLDQLISSVGQLAVGQTNISTKEAETSEISALDDDKQIDIHSRVMERLRKDAEGHVESKQETKQSDIADRTDELEGMI